MEQKINEQGRRQKKGSTLKRLFIVGLFCILVGALILVSVAYYKEKSQKLTPEDIQSLQQQEVGMVLEKISQHMRLPQDKKPTVATITNVDNLRKEMSFFDNAENGFKVVVYDDKAILFDPINDIIVDVAPVRRQSQKNIVDKVQDDNVKKEEDKKDAEEKIADNQEQDDSTESDENTSEEKIDNAEVELDIEDESVE